MNTPRIRPIDPPYSETVQDAFDKIMPPGRDPLIIFRTFAHNPAVLRRQMALGAALLTSDRVPARDRELVILRTCARCGSEYEWGVHVTAYARPLKVSDEVIAATVTAGKTGTDASADVSVPIFPFSHRESLLVRLVDELHDTARISDELWDALAAVWSAEQLIELITLCGMYHAVSFTTNATRMELEPDAERFPALQRS